MQTIQYLVVLYLLKLHKELQRQLVFQLRQYIDY